MMRSYSSIFASSSSYSWRSAVMSRMDCVVVVSRRETGLSGGVSRVTTGPVTPDLPRVITRMVAMIRALKTSTRLLSRRVFNMRVSQAQLGVPVKLFVCRVLPTQKAGRDPHLLEITPNFNTAAGCVPTAGFRLVMRAAALKADQGAAQIVVVLKDAPRAACDTGDRILGQPDAHVDFPSEALG